MALSDSERIARADAGGRGARAGPQGGARAGGVSRRLASEPRTFGRRPRQRVGVRGARRGRDPHRRVRDGKRGLAHTLRDRGASVVASPPIPAPTWARSSRWSAPIRWCRSAIARFASTNLRRAVLPRGLATYDSGWFRSCPCLEELTLPAPSSASTRAFSTPESLRVVRIGALTSELAPGMFREEQARGDRGGPREPVHLKRRRRRLRQRGRRRCWRLPCRAKATRSP